MTGSDDSTVRSMLFTSDSRCGQFSESAEVGSHAVGTHVKALALVPEDGEGTFLATFHCHMYAIFDVVIDTG